MGKTYSIKHSKSDSSNNSNSSYWIKFGALKLSGALGELRLYSNALRIYFKNIYSTFLGGSLMHFFS